MGSQTQCLTRRLEQRRMQAAKLFDQGYQVSDVAGLLGVSYNNCALWKRRYDQGGVEALRSRGRPGPDKRLTSEQQDELGRLLLLTLKQSGKEPTLKTMQALIADHLGVHYSRVGIWKLLRSLGWLKPTPKRAPSVPLG